MVKINKIRNLKRYSLESLYYSNQEFYIWYHGDIVIYNRNTQEKEFRHYIGYKNIAKIFFDYSKVR